MLSYLDNLSFATLSWISVLFYIIHYMEEGPLLVQWFSSHPVGKRYNYNQKKLNFENIILFSLATTIVILFNIFPSSWFLQSVVFGSGIGMLGNFFYHAIMTYKYKEYCPGVITATLLFPLSFFLYLDKVIKLDLWSIPFVICALIFGIGGLPAAIEISHNVVYKND